MTKGIRRFRLRLLAASRFAKRSRMMRTLASSVTGGLCAGLLAIGCAHHQSVVSITPSAEHRATAVLSTNDAQPVPAHEPRKANFEGEPKSRNAQRVADWVVDSGDNGGMPFVIVDKTDARVFVFYGGGRIRGAARVLLGLAQGDDSIAGIGDRNLSEVRPEERTTPAGRFVASMGYNTHGKDVLWVDYKNAVSLHRVITTNPKERRLERLSTPTPRDKRISFGCINVPAKFFDDVVIPAFTGTSGIVYVLPEIRSNREVFARYYDVE